MNRYLKAGIHRVLRRKSRYITLGIIFVLYAVVIRSMSNEYTIYQTADFIARYLGLVIAGLGLVELSYILGEDISSKTMQVAIGCGISRRKLVFNEWLEIMIFTGLDTLVLLGIICGVCAIQGHPFVGEPLRDISIMFLFRWIGVGLASMFSMMISFPRQSTALGNLVYLVYSANVIETILTAVLTTGALKSLKLNGYLPGKLLGIAESRLVTGNFAVLQFLGAMVYLVVFYQIACILFKRKELEF